MVSNAKKRLNSHLTVPMDKYYLSYLRGFLGAFFCVLKQEEGSSKTLGELYEELRGKVCELAGRN